MIVVKHFSLEDLAEEALSALKWGGSGAVRVAKLTRTVSTGSVASMERRTNAIHVRAVVGHEVLAFMLRIGSVDYVHGEPFGVDEGAPARLDALSDKWAERISEYLTAQGLAVRPGLIDLGGAEPIAGDWLAMGEAITADLMAEAERRKAARDG